MLVSYTNNQDASLNNAALVANAIRAASPYRGNKSVATRVGNYTGRQTMNTFSTGATIVTFSTTHYTKNGVFNPVLVFGSFCQTSGGGADVYGGSTFTITASIEPTIGGTPVPVTFGNGATSYQFTLMGQKITDPVPVLLAPGTTFRVRTCVTVSVTGDNIPYNYYSVGDGTVCFDGKNAGSDITLSGSPTLSNGSFLYGPCAILGRPVLQSDPTFVIVGDSIGDGSGDDGHGGWIRRGLSGATSGSLLAPAYSNLSRGGATFSNWTDPNIVYYRSQLAGNADVAICELGINDITASLPTMKTRALAVWKKLAWSGLRVYQTTLGPKTGSSDSWITQVNQYPCGYQISSITNGTGNKLRLNLALNGQSLGGTANQTVKITGITGVDPNVTTTIAVVNTGSSFVEVNIDFDGAFVLGANAGYTNISLEAVRTGFNDWVMDTSVNGARAQSGGDLFGGIDLRKAVEVDINNVPTTNGGYWRTIGGAALCGDGLHPNVLGHTEYGNYWPTAAPIFVGNWWL